MKKKFIIIGAIVLVVIVTILVLILTANPLKGKTYYHNITDYNRYQLTFEGNTLTVKHQYYKANSMSPSGKLLDKSRSTEETYEYELNGKNEIVCDGKTYTFTIGEKVELTSMSSSNKYDALTFDSRFLDISKEWLVFEEAN